MKGFESFKQRCAVDRCRQEIPDDHLLCSDHWAQLSQFWRDRIKQARENMGRSAKALRFYRAACRAAVCSLEGRRPALAIA